MISPSEFIQLQDEVRKLGCATLGAEYGGVGYMNYGRITGDSLGYRLKRIERWINKQQTAKYSKSCAHCGHVKYDIPEGERF